MINRLDLGVYDDSIFDLLFCSLICKSTKSDRKKHFSKITENCVFWYWARAINILAQKNEFLSKNRKITKILLVEGISKIIVVVASRYNSSISDQFLLKYNL